MNQFIRFKSIVKIIILSGIVSFLSLSVSATTYYIDPSASNNGSGTIESPFNSWGAISTWKAGDTYLQKRGTVWNNTVRVGNSGTAGNYITLGGYGEGAKPVIETTDNPGIIISGRSYVKIKDFHIITRGQERYWLTTGIYGGQGGDYNILEDLEIGPAAAHGVYLQGHHNLVVRRCVFYNTGTKDEWDSCDNIHLENCHDYLVEYCVSYNALQGAVYDASDGGSSYTTGTWRYNIGYRTSDSNTEHSNWSIFKMSGHSSQSKVTLLNNIAYGSFNGPGYALQEELDAIAIGNIAYDCVAGFQQVPASNIIKNNIVMNCGEVIYFPSGNFPEQMDHNLYYNNNRVASDNGAVYSDLASFQTATNLDQNSLVADPEFMDAANHDFTLLSGSPAIDAGENIGTEYEMALDPFSSWTGDVRLLNQNDFGDGWEIGPYVYKFIHHIDPSSLTNGNGSINNPYNSWDSVKWQPSGIYLQRRGTSWEGNIGIEAGGAEGAPLIIGSYGEGTAPRIEATDTIAINLNGNDHVNIEDMHLSSSGTDAHGIYGNMCTDISIKGIEISASGGSGIYLDAAHNAMLESLHVHHAGDDNIKIFNSNNYTLSSSLLHDAGGQSLQINGGNGSVKYNKIYNEGGWSLCMINSDISISNNVLYGANSSSGPALALQGGAAQVYNNTIHDATIGIYLQSPGHDLKNNIISNCTIGIRTHVDEFPAESDYNLFFEIANHRVVQIDEQVGDGETYKNYDLPVWQSIDSLQFDLNSFVADPDFENPTTGNFALHSNSFAIDSGTVLGENYQMALGSATNYPRDVKLINQNDHGHSWEIGAYAYIPVYYKLDITQLNGSVEPGSGMYIAGAEVTLTATPDAGYTFESWGGDLNSEDNPLTFSMDSNIHLTVNFTALNMEPVVYEMEYGFAHRSLDDPLVIENRHPGYSGIGAVNTDNELGAWATVIVYANKGMHDMKMRYALGGTSDRPVNVFVNSELQIENLNFPVLGAGEEGWKTWDYANLSVDLNGGGDTIKFIATSELGCANLDRLDVFQDFVLNDTVKIQVENSFYHSHGSGSQVESTSTGYTGQGYLNIAESDGSWWRQIVFTPVSGEYTFGLRYANGNTASSIASVSVDGKTEIAELSFESTGDWNQWGHKTFSLDLEGGYDTLLFTKTYGEASPHIDRLDLLPGANLFEIYELNVVSENGLVTPGSGSYKAGSEISLAATPDGNYTFTDWSGDLISTDNPVSFSLDSNMHIRANYTGVYRLTTLAENGRVDTSGGVFNEGTSISLHAKADSGYAFSQWTGDITSDENPVELVMDSDKEIRALFVKLYKLTTSAEYGTIDTSGGTFPADSELYLTVTPDSGYVFDHWSGDIAGNANPVRIVFKSDKNVVANFIKLYKLEVSAVNGEVSFSDTILREGSEVELLATPDSGYQFVGWEGSVNDTTNPLQIIMNQDITINALFEVITGMDKIMSEIRAARVYPNPFSGHIRIAIMNNTEKGNYRIELYNMLGVLVMQQTIMNTDRLQTGSLEKGVYLLKIYKEQKLLHIERIMKQ